MVELTYQQRAVNERLIGNNEKISQLNSDMKSRANFLTAASTAIVGIITAAKFLPSSGADGVGYEFILLSMVCLCSVGIYWCAALIWKGGITVLAGTSNLDVLYESYIAKSADVAYGNMLADLCTAFDQNVRENAARGRQLDFMVGFFITQLVFLALSVGWASYAARL